MEKDFKFAVEDIQRLNVEEYDENEYCVARMKFLSTRPNSHGLKFSEEVLRRDAKTVLGTWIVAEMLAGDFLTHTPAESIIGIVPKDQDVEFVEADDGYLDAYVDVVLSKRYAKDAYDVFVKDNNRSVSIEFNYSHPEDDEYEVESYVIRGTTILGKTVNPSVPKANITVTRFSEEEADKFFAKVHNNSLTVLKKFVEERKESMADKTYKIDKSKDAMSDTPWQDIDKTELRNKIMEAKNKATLVKSVYLLVEDGWEDAPSEKLKYPVMEIKGDKIVYNRNALASALGYAKKENEESVVSKVEAIYKKLGLGKEEDAKMAEIAFAAVDIGDMWGRVFDALHDRYPDGDWGSVYRIDGIYEQDNKKFAIIHRKDEDVKYRLDFSLTEEGLTLADEIVKVELEIVETDDVKKFAEPEGAEKYMQFEIEGRKAWAKVIKKVQNHEGDGVYVDSIEDNHIIYTKDDVRYRVEADIKVDKDDKSVDADIKWDTVKKDADQKMSEDEMMAKIAELKKGIEERDNIIMEKDTCMKDMEAELADLREFKKTCMEKDKACAVESVMNEVKDFMNDEQFKALREEGMACEFAQIDAWTNKVKAISFESVKGNKKTTKTSSVMWFSAPVQTEKNKNSLWA